jgi:NACalpha-BTF3-like transcription factor
MDINDVYNTFKQRPYLQKSHSKRELAAKMGCSIEDIESVYARLREEKTEYQRFLEDNGINPNSVSAAWFKSKQFSVLSKPEQRHDMIDVIREVFDQRPQEPVKMAQKEHNKFVAVVNIFDAHIDKLSTLREAGEDNTVQKNVENLETAFEMLVDSLRIHKPEKIIFPVGSDFWQTNDESRRTKKGTPMDSADWNTKETFRIGLKVVRNMIVRLAEIAHVVVVPVKGNHDEDRVFYLTECLKLAFEPSPQVTVMDLHRQRTYVRYGKNLFGFAHGDKEKAKPSELTNIMAVERRHDWSEIKQGVFFLGDIHHEKKFDPIKSQDFRGVEVKFLRSAGPVDRWSSDHGYIGIPKSLYFFLYDENATKQIENRIDI